MSIRITLDQRKELISEMPWIEKLKIKPRCEAIKWSKVPLKTVWNKKTRQRQPECMLQNYRCKNKAGWFFLPHEISLPGESRAKAGCYCLHHLNCQGLFFNFSETKRTRNFIEYWVDQNKQRLST